MCRLIVSTIAVCMAGSAASQGSGLFGPDTPWFRDFEAACRTGDTVHPECVKGVRDVAEKMAGFDPATCDLSRFWAERDKREGQVLAVLPWPYGVTFVLQDGQLCR